MKAKFGFSIIFSFTVLFLSACTIDVNVLVNPDGSGSLGATYKLTAEDIKSMEDMGITRDKLCEQLGEGTEGFTYIEEEHEDEIWCIGARPVNSLSEMKTEMQGDGFQINTLEIVGNQFTFDADISLDSGSQDVLAFTFSVSAPGEVIEHNGDQIVGNTVTWNLVGTKNVHARIESGVNESWNGDEQNLASGAPMSSLLSSDWPLQGEIAYIQDGNVWIVESNGFREFTMGKNYHGIEWSPNGQMLLAITNEGEIDLIDIQTNSIIPTGQTVDANLSAEWSPDSHFVAVPTLGSDLYVYDNKGVLFSRFEIANWGKVAWKPDSQAIFYGQGKTLWELEINTGQKRERYLADSYVMDGIEEISIAPSKQNRIITWAYMSEGHGSLSFFDESGLQNVIDNTGMPTGSWSPDGNRYALQTGNLFFPTNAQPLVVYNFSTQKFTEIYPDGGINPTWSPDGEKIAFVTWKGGVYLYDLHSGATEVLFPDMPDANLKEYGGFEGSSLGFFATTDYRVSWSHTGTQLIYSYGDTFYLFDLITGQKQQYTNVLSPQWQPVRLRPAPITDLQVTTGTQSGESVFSWTNPFTDTKVNSNATTIEIRYSTRPIDDESWLEAVALSTIDLPTNAGAEQLWTATLLPTNQRLYFAARMVDEFGQKSDLSNITWLIDTGFRPEKDGFQFCNGPTNRDCDPGWSRFPLPPTDQDYTVEDMRMMFGDAAVCSSVDGDQCRAYLAAQFWRVWVLATKMGGHCYGMDSSAQLFFAGQEFLPSDFQVDAANTHALDLANARRTIAYQYVYQLVDPVLSYMNQAVTETPAQVLDQLEQMMTENVASLAVLVMMQDGKGHSLTPYALEDRGGDTIWIHVYDSNYPDDAERILKVNIKTNEWAYEMGETIGTWDHNQYQLGLIPLSLHNVAPQAPWLKNNRQIWLSGSGHLLISDENGQLGYQDGQYVNTLPGGQFHPVLEISGASEPIYTLPPDGEIRISIYGEATAGFAAIAQFGRKNVASVDGFLVTPKSHDLLVISPDGSKITYMATESKSLTLTLTLDSEGISYQYQVQNADIGPGETISLQSDTATGRLIFSNDRAYGGNYDLMIRRLTPNGEESVVYRNITIANGATHTFDLFTWATDLPILLSIDHDSDGQFDARTHWSAQGEIKDRLVWLNYPYGVIGGCGLSIFGLILFVVGVIGVSKWRVK